MKPIADAEAVHWPLDEVATEEGDFPCFKGLIQAADVDHADRWSWEWTGPGEPLRPLLEGSRDSEIIARHADRLNAEAEDVLEYQGVVTK